MADIKNVGYGDKVMFNIKTEGIKAFYQAKGATTSRSYISERQFSLSTDAISARPAINVIDLWSGRVNMADLIREANREITYKKLERIEGVLIAGMQAYQSPFYTNNTGVNKANLDSQLAHFNRVGPVTLMGDRSAVQQIAGIAGWAPSMFTHTIPNNPTTPGTWPDSYPGTAPTRISPSLIDELNNTGIIGTYLGNSVVVMPNGYRDQKIKPILRADCIYLIPGGLAADQRNLKVVNEGPVQSFESQNIDDLTFEIRLEQWFGAAFISGKDAGSLNTGRNPMIGLHEI